MAKLYLVATPIGNLDDITIRALDVLKSVDVIACEDTRHSQILLNHYGIKKRLISCYKEKEARASEDIIALIEEGKDVALITDAGMPCVSDPGAIVVRELRERGLEVTIVPGPSAVVSALALTGITRRGFTFIGFLPEKKKDRDALLDMYAKVDSSVIFYVSPHDINDDLKDMYAHFGDRRVFVVKELTKMHERCEEYDLASAYIEDPRGEYVVIVEGKDVVAEGIELSIRDHLMLNYERLGNKKDAIKQTAKERKIPKDEVYKVALECDMD